MSTLREMSMLGSLSIGMMGLRKFDKEETQKLADKNGTDVTVLRITKKLFTSADSYKVIAASAQHSRQVWYAYTLPWTDGERIFTSDIFMDLSQKMSVCQRNFENALPKFYEQYPFLKAHDRNILNGIWREEDYPDLEKVKKKFYWEIEYKPIPDAGDFRVDMRAEDVKAIQDNISASVERRLKRSMQEPYARLFDGVAHMAARLSGSKHCLCRNCKGKEFKSDQFGDSLVDDLVELCDILPKLNLTNDQELAGLIDEVEVSLTGFKPDDIRASDALRKTLAARAEEIQSEMSVFFQAA